MGVPPTGFDIGRALANLTVGRARRARETSALGVEMCHRLTEVAPCVGMGLSKEAQWNPQMSRGCSWFQLELWLE